MFEVHDLTKHYAGIPVVDHVSFTIHRGETLGYLGPNGAGKSTTVKMIIGLLNPTSGEISLDGRDIHKDPEARKAFQRRVGYVPEEPHLYPHLSGREHLQLVGRLRGLSRRIIEPKVDELLRLVGLCEDRHSSLSNYSKGMRK
jgi:ABC-2 type transport system ATP-binding protein